MHKTLSCITLLALAGVAIAYGQGIGNSKNNANDRAEHETFDHAKNAAGGGGASSLKITYRGGPVMTGMVNVYYIWYGNWAGNTAPVILENLARSIGGSPYYNINTTYYQIASGVTTPVSNSVRFVNSTNDAYSEGKALTNQKVANIVARAISSGALALDSNGVYIVLTSADVTISGFCTSYCGWHTYGTYSGGTLVKYSFVGNPDQCPSACAAQTVGPNGNAGADGMASIIVHELEEAHTDPLLNAWYDNRGYENADKCAWTFGTMYTTGNGAKANVNFGGRDYLIQRNWNAQTQACAMAK